MKNSDTAIFRELYVLYCFSEATLSGNSKIMPVLL